MKSKCWKRILPALLFLFLTPIVNAQGNGKQSTNIMYSSGRIYVVIAVMLTILFGLLLYLIRLDRKLTKLEKEK